MLFWSAFRYTTETGVVAGYYNNNFGIQALVGFNNREECVGMERKS